MAKNEELIQKLVQKVKGEYAIGGEAEVIASCAYEMGEAYVASRRFDNSRHYHNYRFRLDDGTTVMSSSFFNIFTSRNQTPAYMEAEKVLGEFIDNDKDKDVVFHLVRDQRFGINGAFKASMSPSEPQQLNFVDFVLVIAGFCAGVINLK